MKKLRALVSATLQQWFRPCRENVELTLTTILSSTMAEIKEGQYYYAPHRNKWGVWKRGKEGPNGIHMDDFIMDFQTKIQAKNFVYKANGWNNNTEQ